MAGANHSVQSLSFCSKGILWQIAFVVFHLNMDSKNFLNVVSSESPVNFFSCSLKITEET